MDELASLLNDQLKELKEAVRNRGRINLLVAGKTGVGKSTLINAVFKEISQAPVKAGRQPETPEGSKRKGSRSPHFVSPLHLFRFSLEQA
jgi:predicted GTPase